MPKHKLTAKHYEVLLAVQDGATDFGPNKEPAHHAAALELIGYKFGEPMLVGVNSASITGTTPAGDAALAKHLNQYMDERAQRHRAVSASLNQHIAEICDRDRDPLR